MSRDLHADTLTAAEQEVYADGVLVRLDFGGGEVLLSSTPYPVTFDWSGSGPPATFLGVGVLGGISVIEEAAALRPYSVRLSLSGVPADTISIALGEVYQGRDARIWRALLDRDGQIIGDPFLVFRGRMDVMPVTLGETATVELTVHSRLVDWERARISRYNDADQRTRFPGDLGFEFVAQMKEKELVWGRG